jgi:hypothetical protein
LFDHKRCQLDSTTQVGTATENGDRTHTFHHVKTELMFDQVSPQFDHDQNTGEEMTKELMLVMGLDH